MGTIASDSVPARLLFSSTSKRSAWPDATGASGECRPAPSRCPPKPCCNGMDVRSSGQARRADQSAHVGDGHAQVGPSQGTDAGRILGQGLFEMRTQGRLQLVDTDFMQAALAHRRDQFALHRHRAGEDYPATLAAPLAPYRLAECILVLHLLDFRIGHDEDRPGHGLRTRETLGHRRHCLLAVIDPILDRPVDHPERDQQSHCQCGDDDRLARESELHLPSPARPSPGECRQLATAR